MLWATLRRGFGDCIWANDFEEVCRRVGLPKDDFLVFRPTTDLKGFTKSPADWADASRRLHAFLVLAGVAVPTCAFRLLFSPPAVTLMGHWSAKTGRSSSTYDGARTATEIAYKANVGDSARQGWRPVPNGNIPPRPLVSLAEATGAQALPSSSSASPAPAAPACICKSEQRMRQSIPLRPNGAIVGLEMPWLP